MKTSIKEGDKVKVKYVQEDSVGKSPEGHEDVFVDLMLEYCGNVYEVVEVDEDGAISLEGAYSDFDSDLDQGYYWHFVEEWLEKVD